MNITPTQLFDSKPNYTEGPQFQLRASSGSRPVHKTPTHSAGTRGQCSPEPLLLLLPERSDCRTLLVSARHGGRRSGRSKTTQRWRRRYINSDLADYAKCKIDLLRISFTLWTIHSPLNSLTLVSVVEQATKTYHAERLAFRMLKNTARQRAQYFLRVFASELTEEESQTVD